MTTARWTAQSTKYIAIGLALFVVSASLAVINRSIGGIEKSVLIWFYDWPEELRGLALLITQGGNFTILLGLAAGLAVANRSKLALRVLITGAATYAAVVVAKYLVDRPRPMLQLNSIIEREATVQVNGFPSGHTALVTAVALTLLPFLPKKWRFIVPIAIISVAISRLYLGVHAPLDIIGGFGLGLIAAGVQMRFGQAK